MDNRGFTLLEVLIAVVILAVSLTVLIDIQSRYISRVNQSLERLEALDFFKRDFYRIGKKTEKFIIKTQRKDLPFGIKEVKNIIFDKKTNKDVLVITTYEK